jgi:hypothetical protein
MKNKTTKGTISMRNEDGTQYAVLVQGEINWSEDYNDSSLFSKIAFDLMQETAEHTRKNDSNDNGFFGVYNLRFNKT